jgi:hypothetical protein
MTTELTELSAEQSAIIETKKADWAKMGAAVYKTEMQLQAEAQQALNNISLPVKIEDVPEAEVMLKSVKAAQASIETKRKAITGLFTDVTTRLMVPEKSFADPIKQLSDAIIKVKKEYKANQQKLQNINKEKTLARETFLNKKIEIESALANKVNEFVSRCYEKALNDNITLEALEEYKSKSIAAVTINSFAFAVPTFNPAYCKPEEIEAIKQECFVIDKSKYVSEFAAQIEEKFSDYDVALNNKAAALALSQKQEQEKKDEIKSTANNQSMSVKLEASATPVSAEPVFTKALKKSYEVDMAENIESVLTIMGAFSANINLCLPKLKVSKWFAFTPAQAANVLAKVKCDDNNFAPAGITFKEVDKL